MMIIDICTPEYEKVNTTINCTYPSKYTNHQTARFHSAATAEAINPEFFNHFENYKTFHRTVSNHERFYRLPKMKWTNREGMSSRMRRGNQ